MSVSAKRARLLSLIPDWRSMADICPDTEKRGALASQYSRLERMGLAEWRVVGEPPKSQYRRTAKGTEALREATA